MSGLLGKKIGMTSVFGPLGNHIPVTVVEVEPHVVTQIKTIEHDGYEGIQLGVYEKKNKNTTKALYGHFKKAGTNPKRYIKEFDGFEAGSFNLGDELRVEDVFTEGSYVDVVGYTKGRGFAGVVRRHGFSGVGGRTHGQHNRQRHPGSIGQASDPSRVFKGVLMAGRMGNERKKVKGLAVVQIMPESNLILIKGPIPGPKGQIVEIYNR